MGPVEPKGGERRTHHDSERCETSLVEKKMILDHFATVGEVAAD